MRNKIEKGTLEWQLFNDFWQLHQNFYQPETEDEWYQSVQATNDLLVKYKGTKLEEFAKDLLLAHLSDCERKCEDARK